MKKLLISTIAAIVMLNSGAQELPSAHSFTEDFNDSSLRNFRYGSTGTKNAFKYSVGTSSLAEPGTKILSFKSPVGLPGIINWHSSKPDPIPDELLAYQYLASRDQS